jgi:hypothetical protein
VFQRLLDMVPNLSQRLLEGSEEEAMHIATLVSLVLHFNGLVAYDLVSRFKRVFLVRGPTILRV